MSTQYSDVAFDEGTRLHFYSQAAGIDLREFGSLRVSLGEVRSNDRMVRDFPIRFSYELNGARLDWSLRFGQYSLGAGFAFSQSETIFGTDKFEAAHADSRLLLGRLGGLWQPADRWFLGLVVDYGVYRVETTRRSPTAPRIVASLIEDETIQTVLRAGIAYEFRPNALIHLDYQGGWFSNDTGRLDVHRVMAGTDLPLARFFYLRAGMAIDSRQNLMWTTGLGFYPSPNLTFDLAYQHDTFAEVQREFGHSRTLNGSVSWQF